MAVRDIIFLPDAVLRKKAKRITTFDNELQTLIDDMVETLREAPGVGLAAPQINVSSRLVVVEYVEDEEREGEDDAPKKLYVVINPEIVEASEEMVPGSEACLSIPGWVGTVDRHKKIVIKGLNRKGKPVKIRASNWLARIFQHEIDHLDGIVFTDRASKVWKPTEDEEALLADV